MAAVDHISSQLRLVLYDGDDVETGKPVYRSKSFNNVKASAEPEQLHVIAEAFASLQERPLYTIERRDNSEIRGE